MVNIVSVFGKFVFLLSFTPSDMFQFLVKPMTDAPLSGFHVNHMLVVK